MHSNFNNFVDLNSLAFFSLKRKDSGQQPKKNQ